MKIHCSLLDPTKSSPPPSYPLYKDETVSSESFLNMSSCQLSPQSESSSLNFTIFPGPTPTSDLDNLPSSSSYYSLSPPDLLSPPLSTTSTSEPCLSPSSQSSPPHSNITYNICSQSHNEDSLLQSFGTKDNEASMSIMSRTEAVMQPTGQEQSCSPPHSSHHSLININMNNQPEPDGTITVLSSTARLPDCCNCSQQSEFCSKQSKLKQLYEETLDQEDQEEDNLSVCPQGDTETVCGATVLPAEENFMKLMENSSDKNIKQSMSGEKKERNCTATLETLGTLGSNTSDRKTQQRTQSCPLPPHIPTLDSLSKTSPKLSTWRQTRIISEKLEQHLWTWRCACKKSGKRISKSLLQARAKWAFRKAGIVEFKVIIYIDLDLDTPGYLMKFRGSPCTSGIQIGPNITKSWYFT